MTALLRTLSAAAMLAAAPGPTAAYPIDCAILLCLAGGWPANPHCAAARAEFIRRATPWPIEPPLQIWRCPMGGAAGVAAVASPSTGADVDISDPAFDPVRSIEVWDIRYRQRSTSEGQECTRSDRSRLGSYGPQGEFGWEEVSAGAVPSGPDGSSFDRPPGCRNYRYRGIVVSWTDIEGERTVEEVRY